MEETPETLYQKTKEILDSGTKDRDALNNAVELSAKALKIQTEKYGDTNFQCADYYFIYGDALMHYLETEDLIDTDEEKKEEDDTYIAPKEKLSFNENDKNKTAESVIDLDADLIEEQDDTLEKDKEETKEEKEKEESTTNKTPKPEESSERKGEKHLDKEIPEKSSSETNSETNDASITSDTSSSSSSTTSSSSSSSSSSEEEEDKEEDKEDKEHEGDNIETLQLAWETLESARLLYEKESKTKGEEKMKKELIRTYRRLGDAGLEAGRNVDAASDFGKALKLLNKYYDNYDEQIAQCHLSIALCLEDDIVKQKEHYQKALDIYKHIKQSIESISDDKKTQTQKKEEKKYKDLIDDIVYRLAELKNNEFISQQLFEVLRKKGYNITPDMNIDIGSGGIGKIGDEGNNNNNNNNSNNNNNNNNNNLNGMMGGMKGIGSMGLGSMLINQSSSGPVPKPPQKVTMLQARKKIIPQQTEEKK